MFGRRPDGRRIRHSDPILAFTPYIMPQRVDAQVHTVLPVNCDILTQFIRTQREKGYDISYMDLISAAYVRAVSQYPELNRFVANKQVYSRNSICISLTIIKSSEKVEDIQESAFKIHFSPYDTVYDVHDKFQAEIEKNRKPETVNETDKLVRFLLAIPGLPTTIVGIVKLLDRYGILPRAIINLSPFHTGLFIANMASIGMPHVNHHIYNFGTTSLFIGMGSVQRKSVQKAGNVKVERTIPLGIVSDERITSGAEYGLAMSYFRSLMADPAKLEVPPETVRYEIPKEKMPHLESRRQRRRIAKQLRREEREEEAVGAGI